MNQIQSIREKHRRYALNGLKLRGSPLTALIVSNATLSGEGTSHIPLTAFCALEIEQRLVGWVPATVMVAMAHHWAIVCNAAQLSDDAQKQAFLLGSLTNLYLIDPVRYTGNANIITARGEMITTMKTKPPPSNEILKIIKAFHTLAYSSHAHPDTLKNFHLAYFPIRLIAQVNDAMQLWQNNIEPINTVATPLPNGFPPQDIGITVADNFPAIWASLQERELVSYFSLYAKVHDKFVENTQIAALFTSASTLAKSNFTTNWLNTRVARLSQELPGRDFEALINEEMMNAYNSLFPKKVEQTNALLANMIFNYTIAKQANIPSIAWIIEQSRAPNVSALLGLAEGILKYPMLTYSILLRTFPKIQFDAVAQLCCHLIHNPYLSLTTPPITMAAYADLAYIGANLAFYDGRTKKRDRYMGTPESSATRNKDFLDGVVERIRDMSSEAASGVFSTETILESYGYRLNPTENNRFVLAHMALTERGAEAAGAVGGAPLDRPTLDITISYKRSDIPGLIESLKTAADKAFEALLSEAKKAAIQEALTEYPESGDITALRTTPLSETIRAYMATLQVEVPLHLDAATDISLVDAQPAYKLGDLVTYYPRPPNNQRGGNNPNDAGHNAGGAVNQAAPGGAAVQNPPIIPENREPEGENGEA